MGPDLAAQDSADSHLANTEPGCEVNLSLRWANTSDFPYLVLSNGGAPMIFTNRSAADHHATFCHHVVGILHIGALPQVSRVTASPNITGMTDTFLGSDRTLPLFVNQSMHSEGPFTVTDLSDDVAVTVLASASLPKPTFIGSTNVDVLPKRLGSDSQLRVHASSITDEVT